MPLPYAQVNVGLNYVIQGNGSVWALENAPQPMDVWLVNASPNPGAFFAEPSAFPNFNSALNANGSVFLASMNAVRLDPGGNGDWTCVVVAAG
jgi:hypothetical protein